MIPHQAFAHTPNRSGEWHLLADHLAGTADLAAAFAQPFGADELARAAGWHHDIGKCSCSFYVYLRDCAVVGTDAARRANPSREHKTAGALRAWRLDKSVGPFLATAILGHHGGMSDLDSARSRVMIAMDDPTVVETLASFDAIVGTPPFQLSTKGPAWTNERPLEREKQEALARDIEMLWRLVFSALVDADFLDTEAHFHRAARETRAEDRDLTGLLDRFETRRSAASNSAVNRARCEMYDEVVALAARPPGLYQLAAPTGAGKTQMGLGWALAHAEANGLRRIITAVPFITVTDQVTSDYRRLLDDGPDRVVVEHHSQVAGDDGWARLASENWDAPVVVTTTVRLFESLFARTPSACRRLHRLARSVIVLDEVQGIPVEVLEPVVDALRALVERFGATVLLMTATQPALEHVHPTQGRPPDDLLPDAERWSAVFDRTRIQSAGLVTHADLAALMHKHRQCLCITNTIADAREVTAAAGNPDGLHLSTMLRPADRKARIDDIRQRLEAGADCQVVSTQLVEAGVDLDFPVVLRAMAPLPSLVQADGRCNRNGRQPSPGQTIIFDLDGGSRPPLGSYYSHGTVHTRVMLAGPAHDPRATATVAEWYRRFLTDPAVGLDTRDVQRARTQFRYQATAERFRMIDDDTVSVAVPWPADDWRSRAVRHVLDRLRNQAHVHVPEARRLQDVIVSLRVDLAERALADGLAERITGHLLMWKGDYHPQTGLVLSGTSREDVIA